MFSMTTLRCSYGMYGSRWKPATVLSVSRLIDHLAQLPGFLDELHVTWRDRIGAHRDIDRFHNFLRRSLSIPGCLGFAGNHKSRLPDLCTELFAFFQERGHAAFFELGCHGVEGLCKLFLSGQRP